MARALESLAEMVTLVQPPLWATLLPQAGQWAGEVVVRSVASAAVTGTLAARTHESKDFLSRIAEIGLAENRVSALQEMLKDAKSTKNLDEVLGKLYAATNVAVRDGLWCDKLAGQGRRWQFEDVSLSGLLEAVKEDLRPIAHVDFKWEPSESATSSVCVVEHVAFRLLVEAIANILEHDKEPGSPHHKEILVHCERTGDKVVVSCSTRSSDCLPRCWRPFKRTRRSIPSLSWRSYSANYLSRATRSFGFSAC